MDRREGWRKIKNNLPKNLEWRCRTATRENKKGRAREGIITGVSKKIESLEYKECSGECSGMENKTQGKTIENNDGVQPEC